MEVHITDNAQLWNVCKYNVNNFCMNWEYENSLILLLWYCKSIVTVLV